MKITLILISIIFLQINNVMAANFTRQLYPKSINFSTSSQPDIYNPVLNNSFQLKEKQLPTHWNEPDHTTGFHIGGFLLGLFLPVLGIYIATRIGGKAKQNRKKWAIIGTAVTLGIIIISLISKSTKY